jgi:hypothetical protein
MRATYQIKELVGEFRGQCGRHLSWMRIHLLEVELPGEKVFETDGKDDISRNEE